MNLTELLQYLRIDLLDADVATSWGDTDQEQENALLRYLNRAKDFMVLRKAKSDPTFYTDVRGFAELGLEWSTVGGWSAVTFPEYALKIRKIELVLPNSEEASVAVEYKHISESDGSVLFGGLRLPFLRSTTWTLLGSRRIGFSGDSRNSEFRLFFIRRQPNMLRFAVTDGTTTTFDVDVSAAPQRGKWEGRADYYVGGRVQVVSAADVAPQEEIRDVTAFSVQGAYPAFRFTIGEAFSAPIAAGHVLEIIPPFEDEYHELLAFLAAQRAMGRESEVANQIAVSETMKQLWNQFLSSSENKQTSSFHVPHFDRQN